MAAPPARAATISALSEVASRLPSSATSCSTSVLKGPIQSKAPSLIIREAGPCRSVLMIRPSLSGDEWNGFAERLKLLNHNESINSVLVTCHKEEDVVYEGGYVLPLAAHHKTLDSWSDPYFLLEDDDNVSPRHVMGGLDPLTHPSSSWGDILRGISKLSLTVNDSERKTPFLAYPHGLVTDGGYAFLLGQYVLATSQTGFRIEHPSRGLAFDPCGLSYVLNRVGSDFQQSTATKYASTIAKILALTGYEADGYDLVATGLATHFVTDFQSIPLLEQTLSEIPAYQDQGLWPRPTRSQTQYIKEHNQYVETGKMPEDIPNRRFRNAAVHNLVEATSSGMAGKDDFLSGPMPPIQSHDPFDESADMQLGFDYGSDLVDFAAFFHGAFEENTVHGIMESLREICNKEGQDKEVAEVASCFVQQMEGRSPLALMAVHRLLNMGKRPETTMVDCTERERIVQLNLIGKEDFVGWIGNQQKEYSTYVPNWKHESVAEVTPDEVEELFNET